MPPNTPASEKRGGGDDMDRARAEARNLLSLVGVQNEVVDRVAAALAERDRRIAELEQDRERLALALVDGAEPFWRMHDGSDEMRFARSVLDTARPPPKEIDDAAR